MIRIRPANERGHAEHGWLDTRFSFSFANYHDPEHVHFRALRVLNEDHVQPDAGFPTHGHSDMEILTFVLAGELEHKDSTGTGSVLRPGDVQRMTAGRGVEHSEFNPSQTEELHLLQIWILPAEKGLAPSYEERRFSLEEKRGRLCLIAAPSASAAAEDALAIHQDARIYATVLEPGASVSHALGQGRHAWVQVARGAVKVNGAELSAGDGLAASDESELALEATATSEVLLFDLA